jgi:hypothetical protein
LREEEEGRLKGIGEKKEEMKERRRLRLVDDEDGWIG